MSCSARRLAAATVLAFLAAAGHASAQHQALTPAPAALLPQLDSTHLGRLAVELRPAIDARNLLAPREQRRLDEARRRLELQSVFSSDAELDRVFEGMRNVVRASYVTLYRETLQRERSLGGSWTARSREASEGASSWRPKIEPRLTLGNHGFVSTRLTLPYTGLLFLERLSLEARHGYKDGETCFALRYRNGERRTFRIERVTGSSGERLSATLAVRF